MLTGRTLDPTLPACLESAGHAVTAVRAGNGPMPPAAAWVIDLGLRPGPAIAWLQARRRAGVRVPWIVVAQRRASDAVLRSLSVGMRDWLVRPLEAEQLVDRLERLRRRREDPDAFVTRVGDLAIDTDQRSACVAGEPVSLTPAEWTVLEHLAEHPQEPVDKADLEHRLAAALTPNAAEFHVSRLRRKIGRRRIETVLGRGYRLVP